MYTAIREPNGSIHFIVHAPIRSLDPEQAAEALSALRPFMRSLERRARRPRPRAGGEPRPRAARGARAPERAARRRSRPEEPAQPAGRTS